MSPTQSGNLPQAALFFPAATSARSGSGDAFELEVSQEDVWSAIQPFVSGTFDAKDPAWIEKMRQQSKAIRRLWLRSLLRPWRALLGRGQSEVADVYSARWTRDRFAPFALPKAAKGGTPWFWDGRCLVMRAEGGRRARILYLMRAIAALRPRTVLEVGFGEGLNLALLAARFPEIRFSGVELTAGGFEAAKELIASPALPDQLWQYSPEPLHDRSAHRLVALHRGSVLDMPFADGAFDLVFTSLALEQMERIRSRALAAVTRVAGQYVAMIEPFSDFNGSGLKQRYVRSLGYFQGSVSDLPSFGLQPFLVRSDLPHKVHLQPALVLARKVPGIPSTAS